MFEFEDVVGVAEGSRRSTGLAGMKRGNRNLCSQVPNLSVRSERFARQQFRKYASAMIVTAMNETVRSRLIPPTGMAGTAEK